VSEGSKSVVLRVLNFDSAEIRNRVREFVTEADGTKIKGALSIKL